MWSLLISGIKRIVPVEKKKHMKSWRSSTGLSRGWRIVNEVHGLRAGNERFTFLCKLICCVHWTSFLAWDICVFSELHLSFFKRYSKIVSKNIYASKPEVKSKLLDLLGDSIILEYLLTD